MIKATAHDLTSFRGAARALLRDRVEPARVLWNEDSGLFSAEPLALSDAPAFAIAKEYHDLATFAAMHSDDDRFKLLYRVLWRMLHGEKDLLKVTVDVDVHALSMMVKAVRRDLHKMRAFVRFKRVELDAAEHFIAWHAPDHDIVRHNAEFFRRRFGAMRWTIMTPRCTVSWDLHMLTFSDGVPQSVAPRDDAMEELWLSYYASIFNPGRTMVSAMKAELPMKHWKTLPESRLISNMIAKADSRVRTMQAAQPMSAAPFVPDSMDLDIVRESASKCQGCEIYRNCTQTVFGEGDSKADIVIVGEQPGDVEDLAGRPFVGPAGEVLDHALRELRIDRSSLYLTNAVKHFKFDDDPNLPGPRRRRHQRPDQAEANACKPWLLRELEIIKPKRIIALGATAAQSLLGRKVVINDERGIWLKHHMTERMIITAHPASILRTTGEEAQTIAYQRFVEDLRRAVR